MPTSTGPANGQITINVTAVNDAPTVATNPVSIDEDPAAPVAVVLSGNPGPADEQGQTLTYVLEDLSALHGKLYSDAAGTIELVATNTLTAAGPGQSPVTLYYLPDVNYNGASQLHVLCHGQRRYTGAGRHHPGYGGHQRSGC